MNEDGEHDNSDVAWLWTILIGGFLLGTAIWNFGWQIVTATLVGVPLIVWGCVAAVAMYLASEFHRLRKYRRELERRFRKLIKQARRL